MNRLRDLRVLKIFHLSFAKSVVVTYKATFSHPKGYVG